MVNDESAAMTEPGDGDTAVSRAWIADVADALLNVQRPVPLFDAVQHLGAFNELSSPVLRRILNDLRSQGYLARALAVAEALEARGSRQKSNYTASIRGELSALRGQVDLMPSAPSRPYLARSGAILTIVGSTIEDIDSSYTRRTHMLAQQGRRIGLQIAVVSQLGVGNAESYSIHDVEGVPYHRIPGPARGAIPFNEWLTIFTARLSAVVRKVRPAVVLASSDFVNGLAAQAVSRAFGIPFVYEVRGMWHDSWLARQREKYGWSDDEMPGRWGLPDVWLLRAERELALVRSADAVISGSQRLSTDLVAEGVAADRVVDMGDPERDAAGWATVLEAIGVYDSGRAEIIRAASRPLAVDEVRVRVVDLPRAPLDRIAGFGGTGTTRSIQEDGWRHSSLDPVKITVPFDWVSACSSNRSQAFHLHAWDFMVPFLKSWNRRTNHDSLAWCLERAVDWCETFNKRTSKDTMAWYDMAIGLRAPRLAYLLQEAVHENACDSVIETLAQAVQRHQVEICADQAFNPHTNHGFYTAVGQLSAARRLRGMPAMSAVESQGEARLNQVVTTQFASDGGHLEHSPDYHRMLVASFQDAMQDGLLQDARLADRIERAAEVMGWFIQPDRRIVQIGDSPSRLVSTKDRALQAPHTRFLASAGRKGEPNQQELLLLEESGYGFVRSPQPQGRGDHLGAGYLSFMAGFHSRAHKHCDDLSVTWFDQGCELLVDAGRFGYLDPLPPDSPDRKKGFFYARRERQYVEGVRAHNTVQIDDRDHDRRNRVPYGSGIVSGEEKDGCFQLIGDVDHSNWAHRRTLTYRPGSWLLVEDDVQVKDGVEHAFTVWWNLSEALSEPSMREGGVRLTLPDDAGHLWVTSLSDDEMLPLVKGQESPLRGWRSATDYEFEPNWSLAHRASTASSHTFTTLLTLVECHGEQPMTPFHVEVQS